MGKPFSICTVTMLCVWLLSGCLYPEDRLSGGMEALPRHVNEVQQAVDRYQQEHRVLPIKTEEGDVQFIKSIPSTSGDWFRRTSAMRLRAPLKKAGPTCTS